MTKPESKTALKWMDAASALTKNEAVLQWMEEMAAMTQPDKIVWITGEEEQLEALRKQAVEEGILIKLNEYKLPGCYLHRRKKVSKEDTEPENTTEAKTE